MEALEAGLGPSLFAKSRIKSSKLLLVSITSIPCVKGLIRTIRSRVCPSDPSPSAAESPRLEEDEKPRIIGREKERSLFRELMSCSRKDAAESESEAMEEVYKVPRERRLSGGEVTLQCVERHELVEHTFVSNIDEIKKNHKKWLNENKHLKYLWIPYTDTVVVVKCNPVSKWRGPPKFKPKYTKDEAVQQLRDLYLELLGKYRTDEAIAKSAGNDEPDITELTFTELRDKILALDPLNKDVVVKANQAEADYWRKSEGYRVGWNDEILGFDCGGQQWVSETCFPSGTLAKPNMKDLEYIDEVKQLIHSQNIPAPAPIEQRWTARSKSPMSPASSSVDDDIFSWVGIIMYLPTLDARQRKEITEEFFHYRNLTQMRLWDKYSAYEHWAKIEVPKEKEELAKLQERLRKRFPIDEYNKARMELDPNRILSNRMVEKLFPLPEAK